MARYIDADKLIAERTIFMQDEEAFDVAVVLVSDIKLAPTADVVEVVRCNDCGSYNKYYRECTLNGSHYGENGYCCRGTRTPQKEG